MTSINGLVGAITLRSPMLRTVGNTLHVENSNVKTLAETDPVVGIDVDLNNGFYLNLDANRTLAIPTASVLGTPRDGEKITFTFQQAGDSSANSVTFTAGAGGYAFAGVGAVAGLTAAQYAALQAAAQAANDTWKVGFEFHALDNRWYAVAEAGEFP